MRFVWAVVAFLVAVALVGTGVAQLTVLKGPDSITSELAPADDALAFTVVDSDVLGEHPGTPTITISTGADTEVFVAYGRTADIDAWLSDTSFNRATLADESDVAEGESRIEIAAVEPTGEFADTGERSGWDPRSSDLWVERMTGEGELTERLTLPDGMSMLIATDGEAPAPAEVSLAWRTDVTTPWAGPLIALGSLAALVGLVFWIAGFVHLRRRRGPRRKGPKLPPTAPAAPPAVEAAPESDAPEGGSGTRARRRLRIAAPALVVSAALLAGCSPTAWPDFADDDAVSASPSATPAPEQATPAITDAQAARIVESISSTITRADEENDADVAARRMSGAALKMRETAYDVRSDVNDYPVPATIPEGPVSVLLPQANDGWPRTALVVVGEEEGEDVPTILTMTQDSPWSQYRVSYLASIGASVELPELAPAWLGAALVPPDSSFLQIAPQDLAAAYADVIGKGEDSDYAALFDLEADPFRQALANKRSETRDTFNETAEGTAEISFDEAAGDTDPVSLATFNSGAIVAVSLEDSETLRPTNEDGVIKDLAPEIEHFVGETETATGLTTTYSSELFFFVPAKASEEPIRVLGYSYGLAGSELLPE
ncbi:glycosyl transferase [Microbacterium sp. ZXX196]|uniref:glycosyl transferase n=1 Tax=Microbacterium sp. ZXX196 TaxID=2609291 RepID=UPI0012B9C78B|nr:glycosyl transferase [Microbacterium sp. ZXX196]MTE23695.1 glycosyl transferase [Microbacterium sp. ZXX196]